MIARRRLLLAALPLTLVACGGPLPDGLRPRTDLPRLNLTVGEILFEETYPPLTEANFIDERRTRALAQATVAQLRERITAAGGPGTARITLEKVSVLERLLADRSGGVTGFVTREPTYDLAADVAVRVTILDQAGIEQGVAKAGAGRSRTVRAGTSVLERDAEAQRLSADALGQLDTALPQAVRENLGSWLAM